MYVKKLYKDIEQKYDALTTHVALISEKSKRQIGEIDIIAKKGNRFDIFEVKCSYRRHKARKQLLKFRKILNRESKPGKNFFYCGASGLLEAIMM